MAAPSVTCSPSWSTRRTRSRPTWGPFIGRISAALGRPFMPWQQHVADIAGEIDPETGRLAYDEVILTVPRQSGKTTLLLPVAIHRSEASAHLGGRQRMIYAAQTGKDAKEKWLEDFVEDMKLAEALAGRFTVRLTSGSEHVRFIDGSTFGPISTTLKAGHGKTLDLGILDEAFAQEDARVEQSWSPAMITRPNKQLWVVSTAGTAASIYLRAKVDAGRLLAEAGDTTSGTAYFEWSAPDDADPYDPNTWRRCMPALGHTVDERAISRELRKMTLPGYRRAYLNQWVDGAVDPVIPGKTWANCADPKLTRRGGLVPAFDVSPDRAWASVSIAANEAHGLPMVSTITHGSGTSWLVDAVVDVWETKSPPYVVVDRAGPAATFVDELARRGVQVEVMDTGQMTDACGQFFDAAITEQLRHPDQQILNDAVAGATQRTVSDRWAWDRRSSTTVITPLVSATLALWGHSRAGEPSVH